MKPSPKGKARASPRASAAKKSPPPAAPAPAGKARPTGGVTSLTLTQERLRTVQRALGAQHVLLTASQAELTASRDRYAELFYFAPVGYVTLNRAGQIIDINRLACGMFGETRAILTGGFLVRRVVREHVSKFEEHLRKCRRTSTVVPTELRLARVDGSTFPAQIITAAAREGEKRGLHFRTTIFDLTEIRRAEEELSRANRELQAEIEGRKRLEHEIVRISEHERRRFGQDLHDDLCQQLTGIALYFQALAEDLGGRNLPEASKLAHLAGLVNNATEKARDIARGLHPVELDRGGLVLALQGLVIQSGAGTICALEHDDVLPVLSGDVALALYRIAQEAVANALKHARAKRITIRLNKLPRGLDLIIEDDGQGLPTNASKDGGMGLSIMAYRSRTIGAVFAVEKLPRRGTRVRCLLPARHRAASVRKQGKNHG